jgi:hypothetical protein
MLRSSPGVLWITRAKGAEPDGRLGLEESNQWWFGWPGLPGLTG